MNTPHIVSVPSLNWTRTYSNRKDALAQVREFKLSGIVAIITPVK